MTWLSNVWAVVTRVSGWLGEIIEDGRSDKPSAKRWALVITAISLNYCLIVVCQRLPQNMLTEALTTIVVALVFIATGSYLGGKAVERRSPGGKPDDSDGP